MAETVNLPPDPARMIEGLRDTGYDFNTALADIVDNSVDADATRIDILIQMDTDGDMQISVADDGCGMNREDLLNGMKYGAAGKPNPRRLGKFGLGLKTASTAFCRRLSVISRPSASDATMKATWDLDHVVDKGEWQLLMDAPLAYEKNLLEETAKGSSGTLVIWEVVDRLIKKYDLPGKGHARRAFDKICDKFRGHAGMIYQRFLDPDDARARNIEMTLNGELVGAWNPFCPQEAETEMVAGEEVEVKLTDGSDAKFSVRAYVLPRREHFSSTEAAKAAQLGNSMQGIYVYRENRLIHPADWLGMFSKEPHLTLLRVEFSFEHDLDEAFNVDIKKSRILLNDTLYDWLLNNFLTAPRNAANERYRKGQRKKADKKAKGAHAGSNRNISSKEGELKGADIDVTNAANGEVEITNKGGKVAFKLKIKTASTPGQVFVDTVDGIDDGLLWQPALIDGHQAVEINTGHQYYHKVYVPNLASDVTVQGMDSLLWALSQAELSTINESTKKHFKELRFEVSRLLRTLVEDLPEPDMDGDGE